jgi:hypothetical protein
VKRCSNDCFSICDFCSFYNFNADKNGVYTGRGWCRLLHKRREPESGCKRFHCYMTLPIQDFEKYFRRHFKNLPEREREKRIAKCLKDFRSRNQLNK